MCVTMALWATSLANKYTNQEGLAPRAPCLQAVLHHMLVYVLEVKDHKGIIQAHIMKQGQGLKQLSVEFQGL